MQENSKNYRFNTLKSCKTVVFDRIERKNLNFFKKNLQKALANSDKV